MRIYVTKKSLCCCGKVCEVLKMLAPFSDSRITLKEYINVQLH